MLLLGIYQNPIKISKDPAFRYPDTQLPQLAPKVHMPKDDPMSILIGASSGRHLIILLKLKVKKFNCEVFNRTIVKKQPPPDSV